MPGVASLEVLVLACDLGHLGELAAKVAFQSGKQTLAVDLLNEHVGSQVTLSSMTLARSGALALARGADVLARGQREPGRYFEAIEAHRS